MARVHSHHGRVGAGAPGSSASSIPGHSNRATTPRWKQPLWGNWKEERVWACWRALEGGTKTQPFLSGHVWVSLYQMVNSEGNSSLNFAPQCYGWKH